MYVGPDEEPVASVRAHGKAGACAVSAMQETTQILEYSVRNLM